MEEHGTERKTSLGKSQLRHEQETCTPNSLTSYHLQRLSPGHEGQWYISNQKEMMDASHFAFKGSASCGRAESTL